MIEVIAVMAAQLCTAKQARCCFFSGQQGVEFGVKQQ